MIFLTNEHIQQVLDMPTCLNAMEEAYRELNEKRAGYRPRIIFMFRTSRIITAGGPWKARRADLGFSRSA